MVSVMSRSIHPTTASVDAVTLETCTQTASRERTVAQVEHNAMLALAMVRAALGALEPVFQGLDRISLLLLHSRGLVEASIKPELKRVLVELANHVSAAAWSGEPLLQGGTRAFALDDPWNETGQPLTIALPELDEAVHALSELDLGGAANALALGQRNAAALQEVRKTQRQLQQLAKQLADVLAKRRRSAARSSQTISKRGPDDVFVTMVSLVRDHVLAAGPEALRVQGSPTTRAAYLVEGNATGE
jgi:hypothetical protein